MCRVWGGAGGGWIFFIVVLLPVKWLGVRGDGAYVHTPAPARAGAPPRLWSILLTPRATILRLMGVVGAGGFVSVLVRFYFESGPHRKSKRHH